MGWTEAQQKVIDTRKKNLLVSAAAGSGKTAVLVERIISMISEGENPIDIDHLLVVTFTNAAAAEMRGRIGKAIDAKLQKEPDNAHLQKQVSLLQSAQITTIHSFCLNVLRNYFHRIDLDPAFKIAEESEITLMKSDVIADVLECWYEEGREDFHSFIESYSYSKSDAPVEDLILQLYSFSMSAPWPEKWMEEKEKEFAIESLEDMNGSVWMKELLHYVKTVLEDLQQKNAKAIELCNLPDGPEPYLPALLSDRALLAELCKANTYEEYASMFAGITHARLSGKKQEGVSQQLKDQVKALRDEVKKGLKDLTAQFFFQAPEEMLQDMQAVRSVMHVLFELTADFRKEFAAKKEEKNLIDFNDLEHFALKILVEEKEGEMVPTEAATELSEQFEEILIDEYQDSNLVQETILQSISTERSGHPNRFMVGDVKQSIYKFRLAMPELFMEKYKSYPVVDTLENGNTNLYQRIDLDRNFRSRKVVLHYVNAIFLQIMQEAVGGIVYDQAASLAYGGLFEEPDVIEGLEMKERLADDVELLLVTEEEDALEEEIPENAEVVEKDTEDPEDLVYTKKEIEARVIAGRIKELTHPDTGLLLYDTKKKIHRPAEYRDIVILLRSMTGWSEVFVNTLMQEGIPAYADTGTGYFQTLEITTILNVLRIIDNPRQDIPLAGVLYSPIVGLTTTQLALMRAADPNSSMYTSVLSYAREGSDEKIRLRLERFLEQLEKFRSMVAYTPIHELLQEVLEQTGYYYYVMAMPGGERRKANIDMLISQAVRFERGSYSGLFHFIRYIEKLHKYEVDFGEAATSGEQDNTVRIMSIHKSKGLEFPVVIVGGMSKQFNTQDIRSHIILHSELGVGPEYIDSERRTKVPTLLKKLIQKKVQVENLGEELRVLYVAMTRAKEKLIMTGFLKSMEELKEKDFSFYEMISSKSYLDWVLPAMINRIGCSLKPEENILKAQKDGMAIGIVRRSDLLKEEMKKQIFLRKDEEALLSIQPDQVYDETLRKEIEQRIHFVYPYQKDSGLRVKMTVSELKKLGQFLDEEDSEILYPASPYETVETEEELLTASKNREEGQSMAFEDREERQPMDSANTRDFSEEKQKKQPKDGIGQGMRQREILEENTAASVEPSAEPELEATVPNFIRQKETVLSGADRGTLYHKVLKLMDISKVHSLEELKAQLQEMIDQGKVKEEELRLLNVYNLYKFITSNIAERMRRAQSRKQLFREQQFVFGIKANEINKAFESDELILIQGIIDVFFEEEGELVLLDYKSDAIKDEQLLIQRYEVQLDYYQRALEQMFKKKVKERIIYSLYTGKEIRIDP
ncbi:MAG: helicase-exonuclease AddAB subunit AddA [Lachnospiraceae bacterium]|nr:helicase-exonuclease AddAB subunit AddA [Lachnospiraceae bacterium]